jgi:hypothetical protein
MRTRLIIIISWMVAALLATSTALAASALPTRTTSQAGVTVKATPRALEGSVWEFDVVFDTHSQELKDDLEKTAVLSVAGGETLTPLKWQGDPPGGHQARVAAARIDRAADHAPGRVETARVPVGAQVIFPSPDRLRANDR